MTDSKNEETLKQSLSALFDGEATEFELRQALQASQEPELRDYWKQLSAMQNSLHNPEANQFAAFDISAAVQADLNEQDQQDEPTVSTQAKSASTLSWLKPFSGAAVAATVAAVMVFGVNSYQAGSQEDLIAQQPSNSAVRVANPDYAATVSYSNASSSPKVQLGNGNEAQQNRRLQQQKLESYLLKHTQLNTLQSHQGVVPMARVEAYDAAKAE